VIAELIARGEDPARMAVDRLISLVAARQHSAISWHQLLALGVRRGAIESRVRRSLLHPRHRGVYLWGSPSPTSLARAAAAVLACGEGAALSHDTAAALWGYRQAASGLIEVTTVRRRVRQPGIRAHASTCLDPADIDRLDGIAITTPGRTLLDLAGRLSARELAQALEQAQISGRVTKTAIATTLARPRRTGAKALRSLVAEPAFTRSESERRLLALLRAAKLPQPEFNAMAEGYEVDALWRDERVALEFDSYAFRATRAAFERDRRRDATLTRAAITPLRTTWHELNAESHALVARIAVALARSGQDRRR
jgi:very-short-patch-repair endonuclease